MQIAERTSCYTTTRTVTSWHQGGKAVRHATRRDSKAKKPNQPASPLRGGQAPPVQPTVQVSALESAAAGSAPRAARNSRQRRAAERSAQHHRHRLHLRRLWRKCIGVVLVVVHLLRRLPSNMLREGRSSPSKRTRDEDEEGVKEPLLLAGPSSPAGNAVDAGQAGTTDVPALKRAVGRWPGLLGLTALLGIVLL